MRRAALAVTLIAAGWACDSSSVSSAPPVRGTDSDASDPAAVRVEVDASPPRRDRTSLRVLPLGDSIADGEKLPGGWRPEMKRACAEIAIDFVGSSSNGPPDFDDREHEGHVGWTIDRVAAHTDTWTRLAKPDVVLLMLGTNDVAIGSHLDSAPARLADLVRAIHVAAPRARTLVSTLPPLTRADAWRARVERFNRALPAAFAGPIRDGLPVAVVNVGGLLTASDLRDGVHPSADGNARLGRAWCDALVTALASGSP